MDIIKSLLKGLSPKDFLESKKARAAVVTILGIIAGWFSIEIPEDMKLTVAGVVLGAITIVMGLYLNAQGKADEGKSAELIRDKREREMHNANMGDGAQVATPE